ncbi:MAG: hypothetical protein WCT33_04280 [Patescibacteria group bacterium]|jgi:hypothetical protein
MQDIIKNRKGIIIIRITAILGTLAGIIYWPQSGIFDVVFFEWTIISIWASAMFLLSSVLLVFSFLRFRFKKAVDVIFLTIMLLLNYVALFFYFVANLEMFVSRSNSGESLLANIIGFLGHVLMIAMISISMFKLRTHPIDRTNKRYILRRMFIVIPIVLLVGGFVTAGYLVYSYSTNRVEIDQYLKENKMDIPEIEGVMYGERMGGFGSFPTTENIAESAEIIAQARVIGIGDTYKDEIGQIYHDITITPSVFYKNEINLSLNESIKVSVYGGLYNKQFTYDLEEAVFNSGENVIVFLEGLNSKFFVYHGAYGKLTITDGKVRGISHENGLIDMSLDRYIRKLEKVLNK